MPAKLRQSGIIFWNFFFSWFFSPNDASKAKGLFRWWECVPRLENIKKGQSRRKGMIVVVGGKHRLLEKRCRGKGSFFRFFFLFPLVCVTDNSRAALTLWKQGRVSLQGRWDSATGSHCTWNAITAGFTALCAACLEIQQVSRATGTVPWASSHTVGLGHHYRPIVS